MTEEQVRRYIELEGMTFKGYREYDEMAEMSKHFDLFDIMEIEMEKSGRRHIIESIGYQTIRKYIGVKRADEFIQELIDSGCAKWYEYRKYGKYFYGIDIDDGVREIYYLLH